LCWNTPYKDPTDCTSGRGSSLVECTRLLILLLLRGMRVIVFCKSRARCEALLESVRNEFCVLGNHEYATRVMAYRGGYTAEDRRKIESDMFEGNLLGIVATTALELGIDIGTLDCVLTWGFPYTISNLRQQSGRAGRRSKYSLSILMGDGLALDQHYMQNPDELFSKPDVNPQIDLENILIREGHIQCAAFEIPIDPKEDLVYFGPGVHDICKHSLVEDSHGLYHCHPRFRPLPSTFVAIRDIDNEQFAIIDVTRGRNAVLEQLEASRAVFTVYDGAIFLHQGSKYIVRDFQPDEQRALVEFVNVDWTTMPRDFTDIDPVETEAVRAIVGSPCLAYYGSIRITRKVFGFFKKDRRGRILDAVHVDNPPIVRETRGFWLDVPTQTLQILRSRRLNVAAAIHSAEHAIMSLMPSLVVTMPGDVGTECKVAKKEFARKETTRKRPGRLIFYDAKGNNGGSGTCTKGFEHVDTLLNLALKRIQHCFCAAGCLECVVSEACYEGNEVIGKVGGEVVLKGLLNIDINVEALPMGADTSIETIVPAMAVPNCRTALGR
jgi:DEAD/DEAH box helicase domain-containing protein